MLICSLSLRSSFHKRHTVSLLDSDQTQIVFECVSSSGLGLRLPTCIFIDFTLHVNHRSYLQDGQLRLALSSFTNGKTELTGKTVLWLSSSVMLHKLLISLSFGFSISKVDKHYPHYKCILEYLTLYASKCSINAISNKKMCPENKKYQNQVQKNHL